jgi:hypothetical protein
MSFLDTFKNILKPVKQALPQELPSFEKPKEKIRGFIQNFAQNFQGGTIKGERDPQLVAQEQSALEKNATDLGWTVEKAPQKIQERKEVLSARTEAPINNDNPYESWSKEEVKKNIRPDVQNYLDNKLLPLTREYGIPDSLAATQWALESGRDINEEKPNPFGLMRNGALLNYGGLGENVRAYAETIRNIVGTNMHVNPEELNMNNLNADTILYYLQHDLNGGPGKLRYEAHMENPKNYMDLSRSLAEWRYYQ